MCDYSLHLIASRPARVSDELVSTRFVGSITRGFAAVNEPNVAVCLLPGTELAFEQEVKCERSFVMTEPLEGPRHVTYDDKAKQRGEQILIIDYQGAGLRR